MNAEAKKGRIHTIGRRKTSVARVYLSEGQGNISVNKRPFDEYFPRETLRMIVRQPLVKLEAVGKFDIVLNVKGGGPSGQAGAARHAIARALSELEAENRTPLKREGWLTRDAREVERKKYGRHKARKKPQFSKR